MDDGPVIRTERMILRPWRDADLEPFARLNADPEVMRHFPRTLDRDESDALAGRLRQRFAEDGFCFAAAEVPGVAPFIGFVGVTRPRWEAHFTPCIEIGWRLDRPHWGKGYASEGARAAASWAFETLDAAEIVALTTPDNLRSQAVMLRLGMTRDPADDFDHPSIPEGHPMRRHVLFRLRSQSQGSQAAAVMSGS